MAALAKLFRLLAASVIPGGGFLIGSWSPATALTLYWVDNLVGAITMGVRIALHRRWTGLAGHSRAHIGATYSTGVGSRAVGFRSFLAEFLVTCIAFTIAHGIFLAAVLGFILEPPEWRAVRQGAIAIAIAHLLALTIDSFRLQAWPFARIKHQAQQIIGRVLVVHLAILGGMVFLAWRGRPEAFFSVFVALKFMTDLGTILPQWNPREPPRWLVRAMKMFPQDKGESFEAYWRRTRAEEEVQAKQDEGVG